MIRIVIYIAVAWAIWLIGFVVGAWWYWRTEQMQHESSPACPACGGPHELADHVVRRRFDEP